MLETWLRRAKEAGVQFVVVSPLQSDVPQFLDAQWIPIRPNTDTALMLAMAHTLVDRADFTIADFLARYCTGFDRFQRYLLGDDDGIAKTAEWAAEISGVPPATIRDLARRMRRRAQPHHLRWSLQRAHRGEQPYWMAIALAAHARRIGLPGGGFGFGHGSLNGVGVPPHRHSGSGAPDAAQSVEVRDPGRTHCRHAAQSRRRSYEFNGRRDVYPDIRLVYWAGGNPFHHHQDLNRLRRGLAEARDDHRQRKLVDADGAPCRHRPAGDDDART